MKTASPYYVRISRATVKADCWTCYEVEKKRLNGLLKTVDRISITTDMWKSVEFFYMTHCTNAYKTGVLKGKCAQFSWTMLLTMMQL
ncbi:hypothetical protein Goarm_016794 [Gossypium armourianum]|uniref:Uncharacterized protein n=1 Tax=Gossypium armourianum TaxID=34283 RepID=A0A7J9JDD1_9ROSI|nr:hypothetical protein [Gossypium armourianum]